MQSNFLSIILKESVLYTLLSPAEKNQQKNLCAMTMREEKTVAPSMITILCETNHTVFFACIVRMFSKTKEPLLFNRTNSILSPTSFLTFARISFSRQYFDAFRVSSSEQTKSSLKILPSLISTQQILYVLC